jgi:hypothetical protein
MNILTALRELQDGHKIRRKTWARGAYLIEMYDYLYVIDKDNPESSIDIDETWCGSRIDDLLADDWEFL